MKHALALLLTVTLAAAQALTPFCFKHTENPAGWVEVWYAHLYGSIESDSRADTLSAAAGFYLPLSDEYGLRALGSVGGDDWRAGVALSDRLSSRLYVGLAAGAGDDNTLWLTPGVVLKPTGNIHLTGSTDVVAPSSNLEDAAVRLRAGLWLQPNERWMLGGERLDAHVWSVEVRHGTGFGAGLRYDDKHRGNWRVTVSWQPEWGRLIPRTSWTAPHAGRVHGSLGLGLNMGGYAPARSLTAKPWAVSKRHRSGVGLVAVPSLGGYAPTEVSVTVKAGDNLTRIAQHLPPGALPEYRGNVRALADYNNITDPSRIYVGQVIRVPSRITTEEPPTVDDSTRALVTRLLDDTHTTGLVEAAVNGAFWRNLLEGTSAMERALPAEGDVANPWLLNAAALADLQRLRYPAAVRRLRRAMNLAPDEPVLHGNLGQALYWAGQTDDAFTELQRARELGLRSPAVDDLLRQLESTP